MKNHQLSQENKQLQQRILALETQLSEQKVCLTIKRKQSLKSPTKSPH